MNGRYDVDEATFRDLPHDQQNWILFSTFNSYRVEQTTKCDQMECRVLALEKKRRYDSGLSAAWGMIGGFMAVLVRYLAGLVK